jgi:hypothetical protein
MVADEWDGWPEPGARVRVPHWESPLEGEVMRRYRLLGDQVADVRVRLRISGDPDGVRAFDVPFEREALEIISD